MSDLSKLPTPGATCVPPALDKRGADAFHFRFGTATVDASPPVPHTTNTDLAHFPNGLGAYSKGLKQSSFGIAETTSFQQFLKACGVIPGGPLGDFEHAPITLGGPSGRLNGPRGAFALQQVGKDSSAFGAAVVPAPYALDSIEYAVELVELYWGSLLRDTAFSSYASDPAAIAAAAELEALNVSSPGAYKGPLDTNGRVTTNVLFRGGLNAHPTWFAGETVGPYLSQFCLLPTALGRIPLDQKIKTYVPDIDFMTTLTEWFNVQNGGAPTGVGTFDPLTRYMRNGRDTGAYTQVDELYQAYLIAYLVGETLKIPRNPTNPYAMGLTNEKAFGDFGGPDISATIGAVARAALNAVWYQKWAVHLRHRPEAGGGIAELIATGQLDVADAAKLQNFDIVLNSQAVAQSKAKWGSHLLSQAFPEGSPTHPAYPTGHGTVAGACITVLKFFMNGDAPITNPVQASADGLSLTPYAPATTLTVNGELHKLAHNISFGHGIHTGIHWRSDTDYSILLGEAVAIAWLEDQMFSYQENFDVVITKIDGTTKHFKNF